MNKKPLTAAQLNARRERNEAWRVLWTVVVGCLAGVAVALLLIRMVL